MHYFFSCHFTIFRAPTDCFQYLTGISGSIKSLNYPTTALTDILYTICVRREYGYCGIEWSESAITSPDPFDLNSGTEANALVGGSTASASDVYLSIPGNYLKNLQEKWCTVAELFLTVKCKKRYPLS